MNFWELMIRKDDLICSVINACYSFYRKFYFKEQRLLSAMKQKPVRGVDRDIYIILNGPSLKNQDLRVLKGKSLLFVNRGFSHPLYKELKPEFHAFIDPKMLSGEWPVTWIDDILAEVPNITFIMPASWALVDKFQPYIKSGVSFHWVPADDVCTFLGVSGACFEFAISQKFRTIYFTGFDANGLGYELVKASSHFYGTNEENLSKTTKNYVIDLFMHSRHLRDLNRFAEKCRKRNIDIVNLTNGGLLDMFQRKSMSESV